MLFNTSFQFTRFVLLLAFCLSIFSAAYAVPAVSAYGALPGIERPTLSPSGQRMVMVTTLKGERVVLVTEIGKQALMLAKLGDQKIRRLYWAGENFVLVDYSTTQFYGDYGRFEKSEFHNLLVMNIAQKKITAPLQDSTYFNAIFGYFGSYEKAGHWKAYVGSLPLDRNAATGKLHLASNQGHQLGSIDLESGKIERVTTEIKNGWGWLIDSQGTVIANERYDVAQQKWNLYAGAYDEKALAQFKQKIVKEPLIEGQGRSAGTVLYKLLDDQGKAHYFETKLDGSGAPVELFADVSIQSFIFDSGSGLLDGYYTDGQSNAVFLLNPGKNARIQLVSKTFPDTELHLHSFSAGYQKIVVETENQTDSGTVWLVDLVGKTADPIGLLYPSVQDADVGSTRLVKYKAQDGLTVEGILTLPPSGLKTKLPLVVLPHGGPEAYDRPHFNWWAQAFVSRGYAVWQPNFRGSSGYGMPFRNAGFGEFGRKMESDISDGITELAREGGVDPQRACIVGASYGGYAALAGVTLQQGIYRCAVAVAGVADIDAFVEKISEGANEHVFRYWQQYLGESAGWNEISPIKWASKINVPVLLIHGKDDTVVPYQQSESMYKALKRANKPVELLTLDDEDHWLSVEKTRIAMLEASVAFVLKHNPVAPQTSSVQE